jgi:outer membrane protein OmpA-like peptidoglycan-associated protein
MGISSNRIEAIGYGEAKPEVSNDTAEHRQINRRVTARIVTK